MDLRTKRLNRRNALFFPVRRRPTISESTRPVGLYPVIAFRVKRSRSAVPPPPARRFGGASSADAANPQDRFYTTGLGNASADPLVDRGMASLARTGRRGNGNARSPSPQVASLVFGRRPSRNEFRCQVELIPLLIRC